MKLKTLKDLGFDNTVGDIADIKYKERQIPISQLKQEAIKWVKQVEKENEKFEGEGYGRQYVNIMIDFFNITEEDLK